MKKTKINDGKKLNQKIDSYTASTFSQGYAYTSGSFAYNAANLYAFFNKEGIYSENVTIQEIRAEAEKNSKIFENEVDFGLCNIQ